MTSASGGGSRSASIASSSRESRSQPLDGFDLILDPALLGEHLVHLVRRQILAELGVDLVVARQQRADLGDAFLDVPEHRLGRVEPWLLVQEPDADALGRECLAEKALILPRHDAQEAALPRPVQAEDADLRARKKREPDVLEDDVVGLVDLAQTLHGVDELHAESLKSDV